MKQVSKAKGLLYIELIVEKFTPMHTQFNPSRRMCPLGGKKVSYARETIRMYLVIPLEHPYFKTV